MAPDINSLSNLNTGSGSSRLTNTRPMAHINIDAPPSSQNGDGDPSPSPRSPSTSLQAAATLNAGLQRGEPVRNMRPRSSSSSLSRSRQSPSADRRRSQILTTLQIADPGVPAPGEMVASDAHLTPTGSRTSSPRPLASSPRLSLTGPPHRDRAPSLGELHQELENEQEFQVNRLLQEIRRLQVQVQRQQQQQQQQQGQSAVGDEPTDRFGSLQTASAPQSAHPGLTSASGSLPRSPGFPHPRSSFDMARADIQRRSRTPSRGASPMLRSTSIGGESGDQWLLGGRDENAFYQAETQMLIRENQMLRHRIRDLERQLSELTGNGGGSSITHEPPHSSNLNRSTSVSEDDSTRLTPATSTSTPLPTVADAPKEE